jgi:lipid-binding SYLF domain-containing protein
MSHRIASNLKRLGLVCVGAGALFGAETSAARLATSDEVRTEIMSAPDKGIPRDLLEKSQCAVIVPGLKKGAALLASLTKYSANN